MERAVLQGIQRREVMDLTGEVPLLYTIEAALDEVRSMKGFVGACVSLYSFITLLTKALEKSPSSPQNAVKEAAKLMGAENPPLGFKAKISGSFGTILVDVAFEENTLSLPTFYTKGVVASLSGAYPVLLVTGKVDDKLKRLAPEGKGMKLYSTEGIGIVTFKRHMELMKLSFAEELEKRKEAIEEIEDVLSPFNVITLKSHNTMDEMEPFPFLKKPVDTPDIKIISPSPEAMEILESITEKAPIGGMLLGPFGMKIEVEKGS